MITSHVLKFADSCKTQKSKHLENTMQLFPLVKKIIRYTLRAILWQTIVFLVEVIFNPFPRINM